MDPLHVLAFAELDAMYRDVAGVLPERPGRDLELHAAVLVQITADDAAARLDGAA